MPHDRLLEEKIHLVLDAFFRKGAVVNPPTARDVAARTGASIEFVQLLQRVLMANGWASGIADDRIFANSKDGTPVSSSLIAIFRNYLRA